ncbi:signal transduction protein [Nostoc commune NIES-4072]|uniref:Signal transduction protein n=1 Tax=Nostoc commune NIES-4072 TaxID=2005467 RepID=A0A2R5FVV4_NOSCO|nr:signal transduction protein [Nostoc commune HK-02]GBG22880.1 signal transduction protein [Nostoc commune NIES-4072]
MATEQELQSLFNKLDTDLDGKISINDLFLSPGLSTIISSETFYQYSPGIASKL